MKTEIIVLKFNNPEVEDNCIKSVIACTTSPYSLTVYDNYPQNNNIGGLWNRLIDNSDCEYICLLNSDTIVPTGWLEKLLDTFNISEKVGVVGPSTDNSHNSQSKLVDDKIISINFSTFKLPDGKPEILSGFCLVFPKKVWAEVGGFPEDYGFYGQEVKFIDNILEAGYYQIWRKDVFIHHEGSATVKKLAREGKFDEAAERKLANDRRIS
jgi:cellulose synthase/poly-beta-1,6-N-acetylglucosamine synthase-like glycosyltransferase